MRKYKRDIVRENLLGHWKDAMFYATPDEMLVQFTEVAYPNALAGRQTTPQKVRRLQ